MWLSLTLLVWFVSVLLVQRVQRRRENERMRQYWNMAARPAPEPPAPEQTYVSSASLPSAVADYRLLFAAKVFWHPTVNASTATHRDPAALARYAIVARAADIAANERPDDHSLIEHKLNSALGVAQIDSSGCVEAWASEVSIALSDDDKQRLDRLSAVRKEVQVWEHERRHERNVREYLGLDVLNNPGSAVVWYLARKANSEGAGVQDTVKMIGDLQRLTAAAHSTEIPDLDVLEGQLAESPVPHHFSPEWQPPALFHLPADGDGHYSPGLAVGGDGARSGVSAEATVVSSVEKLLAEVDEAERPMFADRLSKLLDTHGQTDVADEIRTHFASPSAVTDEPQAQEAASTEQAPSSLNGDHPG